MVAPPLLGGGSAISPSPLPVPTTTSATGSPPPGTSSALSKAKAAVQSAPGTLNGPPSGNNHAIPLSARRAEPLDLTTVERRGQPFGAIRLPAISMPSKQQPPKKNRLFGIPDAPVYRPSEDEFREPMEYIRKIAPEGSKYGIVKIIPPDTWNPTFAINTERFHFRTRRQELNAVEGGNRINNDYLDQLAKFHKQNGHNLNRFPSVDKRPLDLYRLKKTVERKGGFDSVCKGKRWAEVGRDLGYSGKIMSSLSTSLKNSYQKWLLPYEEYLRVAKPGVHQQIEMANGGPYTPSPGTSPAKKSQMTTPLTAKEEAPVMQASAALHSSITGQSSQGPTPIPGASLPPPPVVTGGFTAVNAVPAASPPNIPSHSSSFTPANGDNPPLSAIAPRATETPPSTNGQQPIAPDANGIATLKRQHSDSILTADEVEAINRRSKRLRKDVPTIAGSNMHHSRMSSARLQTLKDRGNYKIGEVCESCGKSDDQLRFIACQSCDCTYHMYCLEPPLKQKPDYEWHCPKCLVGTNEYGFEEGDVYSLAGFQRRANEFKYNHFNGLPPQFNPFTDTKNDVDEEDVEREFWRLVEDNMGTTEVEYGADIHSTTHGSGFPTIEKQPRDPYSFDPWNLNMLPLDKDSLFRHIKSDISGMTVPWLYVGMIFSTFCWHNEDHYAYSANYQHLGETKTWYGVPADDSDKFEKAMRDEVPELFETQPDILFQLVTLAKPEKLRKAGVRVFAIDQRAGEFVITFPQAYHAGFNHGFNFNEAVNFAPVDWEPFGEEGVRRLRDYRKQPCFSHDELLVTAASRELTIKTAKWLAPALERMRDEELAARKHFITGAEPESGTTSEEPYLGPRYESLPDFIDPETEEDEVICSYCKCYCYLSRYQCKKTAKYLCALHAGGYQCCDALEHERYTGRDGTHRLYYRMDDETLDATVQKVVEKANIPENWMAKYESELENNEQPQLKHLRTLLAEGERVQYDLPALPTLRTFVERCNEWVEEATSYITRKQQNRRKSEKTWRKSTAKHADLEEREKELRKVENIQKLLARAETISFDCPEIATLQERAQNIIDFQLDAREALNNIRGKTTAEFQELIERGREFHVDIPEIDSLEQVVKRLTWDETARLKRPNAELKRQEQTLQNIEEFIAEGIKLGVPENNPDMVFFREHKAQGDLWEQKAKELMAVEQVHYQQLDSLSQQALTLPVNPETLAAVDTILKKQREVQDKIASLIYRSKNPDLRDRPLYREMKEVMDSLEELQSKPNGTIDLEKQQRKHEDWMRKGKKLFGKANAPLHILNQHMNIVRARNEACFEISDKPRIPVEPSSRHVTPEEGAPLADGSNSSRDVFCICRKSEAGMMIECELCHEWYHGKCLKIARGKVKEDDKYTCPICDWRVKIPRDAARPKLEELQAWHDELDTLPFQPDEEDALDAIITDAQNYRDYIRPIVTSDVPTTSEEVATMRFHLRKVEGADILLSEETNFLRQELHKWAPVAPEAPPIIQQSSSTRKPRPTKQQKLMASLGITDPEQLPQEFKMRHQYQKKKGDEGGSIPPTLQPAGRGSSAGGSVPPTPGAGQSGEAKPFYTALSLHVLGSLASAPVVTKMLQAEPHMNREKLYRMKAVLEADRGVWDDIKAFQQKMTVLPSPAAAAHSPSYNFEAGQDRANPSAIQGVSSPMFATSTANDARNSSTSQPPQHASPTRFSPGQRYEQAGTPPASSFERQMFHGPPEPMFESPANEAKANHITSPETDFGGASRMFDSPKATGLTQAGINSPGFGGSQQSVGHMDKMFADLVNEREASPGFDGANDAKGEAAVARTIEVPANDAAPVSAAAVAAPTEAPAQAPTADEDVQMTDVKDEEPVVQPPAPENQAAPSTEQVPQTEPAPAE
ncbi:PLU-1-like protein-domain-containing protein [Neohortaea acidophila]|uniref:PLU-1-like protein-domain-containing protein n=1 Tax=Neohortaea acidophila TaxID=245834 RepID=A0A6A6PUF6_9PEZI|nr:PLU-1-like protein-domain-containing protein [Neohortaea acidophila]KAF2483535.1 PLU-1-like protein-domain-containing protein [Neohortaea acidophila]